MKASPLTLGTDGSDRATAYHMRDKTVFVGKRAWITWQSIPFETRVTEVDLESWTVVGEQTLGLSFDNHCAASMLRRPDGRVHVVQGAHHQSFLHLWSDNPADPKAWSLPEVAGCSATYPAIAFGSGGKTLHLAYRSSNQMGGRWTLNYQRADLSSDRPVWTWGGHGRPLLRAPFEGYCHWGHSLETDANGTLHLIADFYKRMEAGGAKSGYSPAITHLYSEDDGDTWHHADGRFIEGPGEPLGPAGLENVATVLFEPGGCLRAGPLEILRDGSLVFFALERKSGRTLCCRRPVGRDWTTEDWTEIVSARMPEGWRPVMPFHVREDTTGGWHMTTTVGPDTGWTNPAMCVLVLRSGPQRGTVEGGCLEHHREGHPDWHPDLAVHPETGVVYLLYQSGMRASGETNEAQQTRCVVLLRRLETA